MSALRPIRYAFDPAGVAFETKSTPESFLFLKDALTNDVTGFEESNIFNPQSMHIPWPSSLPAAAQCKHWKEAEVAAASLLELISAAAPPEQGLLPVELSSSNSRATKERELLETAVTAPMNMFPAASVERARIMAKANMFIFMHDDVIESKFTEGTTIIDSALSDLAGAAEHPDSNLHDRTWKNKIFHDFAREVLQEDSVVGPLFLRGILNWVQHTRSQLPCEMKFSTFPNYVDYRIKDFAVDFCDAARMLTCNIYLSPADMEPLSTLHRLHMMHFTLTNDLYSYDKEVQAMREHGSALVNGVRVLEHLLTTSARTAKVILRAVLWDLEAQIDDEYGRLVDTGDLDAAQTRFARGMIETLAGNLYYSATTARYAEACAVTVCMDGKT